MFFNLPIHPFNLIFISRKHLSCLPSNWNQWPRRGTCYRATRWRAVGPILPLTINQTCPYLFNLLFRDHEKLCMRPFSCSFRKFACHCPAGRFIPDCYPSGRIHSNWESWPRIFGISIHHHSYVSRFMCASNIFTLSEIYSVAFIAMGSFSSCKFFITLNLW